MNLLCPNCQKPLTVPDQYAGQLMKCPLCNGTFGVPGLPPPAPAPTPAAPDVFRVAPEPPPPPRNEPAPKPEAPPKAEEAPAPPPPPPPTGYEKTARFTFRPEVLAWVAPVAMLLVFLLLF